MSETAEYPFRLDTYGATVGEYALSGFTVTDTRTGKVVRDVWDTIRLPGIHRPAEDEPQGSRYQAVCALADIAGITPDEVERLIERSTSTSTSYHGCVSGTVDRERNR